MVLVVAIMVWGIFIGFIYWSRKEQGHVLQKISIYLYKKISTSSFLGKYMKMQDRQVLQNLMLLHPGEAPAQLLTEYYTGKIRIVILILLVGSGIACCAELAGNTSGIVISDGSISRPKERREIMLEAVVENAGEIGKQKVTLDVSERLLSEKEAESLCEELVSILDELILGKNLTLQEVRDNLNLPYEVEGYPFSINWKSSNNALLASNGTVYVEDLHVPVQTSLVAEFIYGEYEWKHSWDLTLHPPDRTEQEQLIYDLTKLSEEADSEQRYEENLVLPQTIDGKKVSWSVEKESSGGIILLVALSAAVTVYYMKDKDLQDELIKRRSDMRMEYPVLVSKYALLLEAGMTVRGAFVKICRDHYEKEKDSIKPVYEEMLYSCNELKAGVSESKVYETFGRRTGLQEYTRLCTLLNQNLKKGNTALSRRLREESEEAVRENLQLRKRQGEEAGTKLLAPMGMMLIMVLVMIMLPAFAEVGV